MVGARLLNYVQVTILPLYYKDWNGRNLHILAKCKWQMFPIVIEWKGVFFGMWHGDKKNPNAPRREDVHRRVLEAHKWVENSRIDVREVLILSKRLCFSCLLRFPFDRRATTWWGTVEVNKRKALSRELEITGECGLYGQRWIGIHY